MKKIFPIFASISVLIIAFSAAYYFVIFLPNKEKANQEIEREKIQIELQKQEKERKGAEEESKKETQKRMLLQSCLKKAADNFTENWNDACEQLGRPKECNLPASWADSFNEKLEGEKNDCYKQYPLD